MIKTKKIILILLAVMVAGFAFLVRSPLKPGEHTAEMTALQNEGESAQSPETAEGTDEAAPGTEEENQTEETSPVEIVKTYRDVSAGGRTFSTGARMLDMSSISRSELAEFAAVLPEMDKLVYVNLGQERDTLSLKDLDALYAAAPGTLFAYQFSFMDRSINTYDEVLDLNHIGMADEGAAVRGILPYMRNLKTLDMDSCGVSNEAMAGIRDDYPDVEVIWRIWFGSAYTARTDATKILASKPSWGGEISDESAQVLKYCTKLKFLDLGHNEGLSDFSFISYLKDLRVAVVSITQISDLSPFAACPKIWYIEAGNCKISDLSPLAACKNLQHLNVGTNFDLKDISPIYDLNLKRLWLGVVDPVPAEQVTEMRTRHPGIEIDTTVPSGLELDENGKPANEGFVMGRWKTYKQWLYADWLYQHYNGTFPAAHPKNVYRVIYDSFEYELVTYAYAFESNDKLLNPHESIYQPTPLPEIEEESTEKVVYLCSDTENEALWKNLASRFTEETGIAAEIQLAEKDGYTEVLRDRIAEVDAPTVFELTGAVQLEEFGSYCEDLSGTGAVNAILNDDLLIHSNGRAAGTAANSGVIGMFVNNRRLSEAGHTAEEIKSFADLQRIVAEITENHGAQYSTFAAFVVPDMEDITENGLTMMLANMPIAMELQGRETEFSRKLEGTYIPYFRQLWDMIMYNSCCSNYDLNPALPVTYNKLYCREEFSSGQGVFYIARSDEFYELQKYGMTEDDMSFIPVYLGTENESGLGYSVGTDRFWCVNANSAEEMRQASKQFIDWCTTSETGTAMLAEMGYVLPYENAKESENPFTARAMQMLREGRETIPWFFSAMPSESWRDEVNYEMGACGADLGDWDDITNEIIGVWEAEYMIR